MSIKTDRQVVRMIQITDSLTIITDLMQLVSVINRECLILYYNKEDGSSCEFHYRK